MMRRTEPAIGERLEFWNLAVHSMRSNGIVGLLRRVSARLSCLLLVASLFATSTLPASAAGLPLIRDSEIEGLLNDYAQPIFKAAGLGSGRISMRIVRNDSFNAFVVDGRNVFVHTGTLTQADTPNEVIGVIAHEAGHISGGHLAALRERIKAGQAQSLLAQILGIGLIVAGGVSGSDTGRELGGLGTGVLYGGNDVIMRSILAERRSQEAAADQAGLAFLKRTKQSGKGMLLTFERFAQQEYISDTHKDPFVRSHPVATTRLARLREAVAASPYYEARDSAQLQLRHDLMRAKLSGYLERPAIVFNRYPVSNTTLPARYARAIARYFRGGHGALEAALRDVDGLIKSMPRNGYFYELKGDLLLRAGKSKRAIPWLEKALSLKKDSSLIQVQLATALQNSGDKALLKRSVSLLLSSLTSDKNPRAYRLLATAFYHQGKRPLADATTAEAYFQEGNLKQAQIFAKRAQKKLKRGSTYWNRNEDIINFSP